MKDSNIALLVVFNHRFDKNLPALRKYYNDRFSNVFYLIPFYDGSDEDVIPVYYPSNTFQGYFSQAYQSLKKFDFNAWFVVADDMLINPEITEDTLFEKLNMNPRNSFIPRIGRFNSDVMWDHANKSLSFTFNNRFIENEQQLPSYDDAFRKLQKHNFEPLSGLDFKNVYHPRHKPSGLDFKKAYSPRHKPSHLPSTFTLLKRRLSLQLLIIMKRIARLLIPMLRNKRMITIGQSKIIAKHGISYLNNMTRAANGELLTTEYPFCFGYSDIFCIGKENLKEFCHYCGVFAASGLFVEIAIPTALVLATKGDIIEESHIEYSGKALWEKKQIDELFINFDYKLDKLMCEFPSNYLFLHPVKFSQWK